MVRGPYGADVPDEVTLEEINARTRIYLETVLNSLRLGIIVLDRDFRITFFNRDQALIFQRLGVEPDVLDLIGADAHSRYAVLDAGDWAEARLAVTRGATLTRSRVAWPPDEPQAWFDVHVAPLDDGAGGALCTSEDVSAWVKLEANLVREERMSLVGQMAIALNHEINNPLAVILGQADALLSSGSTDSDIASGLRSIVDAARRIESVTRKLRLMEEIPLTPYVKGGPLMVDLSDRTRP